MPFSSTYKSSTTESCTSRSKGPVCEHLKAGPPEKMEPTAPLDRSEFQQILQHNSAHLLDLARTDPAVAELINGVRMNSDNPLIRLAAFLSAMRVRDAIATFWTAKTFPTLGVFSKEILGKVLHDDSKKLDWEGPDGGQHSWDRELRENTEGTPYVWTNVSTEDQALIDASISQEARSLGADRGAWKTSDETLYVQPFSSQLFECEFRQQLLINLLLSDLPWLVGQIGRLRARKITTEDFCIKVVARTAGTMTSCAVGSAVAVFGADAISSLTTGNKPGILCAIFYALLRLGFGSCIKTLGQEIAYCFTGHMMGLSTKELNLDLSWVVCSLEQPASRVG